MIAIVDYGMGNLRSVQKACELVGHEAHVISQPEQIDASEKLILPGIGAFKDAVVTLRAKHLDQSILRHINRGKPFLGVCLGLQMLFDTGHEDGIHQGLGLFPGACIRFDVDTTLKLKVPHMGWNQLHMHAKCPLYNGLPDNPSVYFVHGYHVAPTDNSIIATTTDYGRPFVSSVCRDNVMATQFHPEKSQKIGLQMLRNFGEL